MFTKIDRFVLLRRLTLLALAAVLIVFALAPPLTACSTCTEGSVRTVYFSIACCSGPPPPSRFGQRQICQNCQWVVQSSGCFRASACGL